MAVYEHRYRAYEGWQTPTWSRFLIPTRYALQEVFASRLFVGFFLLCFVPPMACAALIYLRHNLDFLDALQALDLQGLNLVPIDARFFRILIAVQGFAAFLIALIVGPALISPDLRNNALPLYLSRPLFKIEYILGKMAVLWVLLSAVTWLPGCLLFSFQSLMAGGEWMWANLRILGAFFLGSWVWIGILSLLCLALSAWVKWKPLARILFLGLYVILAAVGQIFNAVYDTWKGSVLVLDDVRDSIWNQLFAATALQPVALPPGAAWVAAVVLCVLCLVLLARRVKAYEVVK